MKFPTRYSPENRSGNQWLQEIPQGFHPGVDFNYGSGADDEGQDVVAVADGIVTHAKFCTGWGNHVIVYHPKYNVWSHYAHLKSFHVENQEEIKEGQLLGQLGGTGGNWSPHLHFEIRLTNDGGPDKYVTGMTREDVGKNYTDPEKWMNIKIEEEGHLSKKQVMGLVKIKNSADYCILGLDGKTYWIPDETTFESGKKIGLWPDYDKAVDLEIDGQKDYKLKIEIGTV
jgi:murein DD-endopeptidase MepM/ murein hydrolase activator NlpD